MAGDAFVVPDLPIAGLDGLSYIVGLARAFVLILGFNLQDTVRDFPQNSEHSKSLISLSNYRRLIC